MNAVHRQQIALDLRMFRLDFGNLLLHIGVQINKNTVFLFGE